MLYYKVLGDVFGNNIEISIDLTRWLVGFGWLHSCIHINLGPLALIFAKRLF